MKRFEAIKYLNYILNYGIPEDEISCSLTFNAIEKAIEELCNLEWVLVSDSMPKNNANVWVTIVTPNFKFLTHATVNNNKFIMEYPYNNYKVYAWMPDYGFRPKIYEGKIDA